MSDTELRDLEREWQASGSEEVGERLLMAKIRSVGSAWLLRHVLATLLGIYLRRSPSLSEILFWLDHHQLLCEEPGCRQPTLERDSQGFFSCEAHREQQARSIQDTLAQEIVRANQSGCMAGDCRTPAKRGGGGYCRAHPPAQDRIASEGRAPGDMDNPTEDE